MPSAQSTACTKSLLGRSCQNRKDVRRWPRGMMENGGDEWLPQEKIMTHRYLAILAIRSLHKVTRGFVLLQKAPGTRPPPPAPSSGTSEKLPESSSGQSRVEKVRSEGYPQGTLVHRRHCLGHHFLPRLASILVEIAVHVLGDLEDSQFDNGIVVNRMSALNQIDLERVKSRQPETRVLLRMSSGASCLKWPASRRPAT